MWISIVYYTFCYGQILISKDVYEIVKDNVIVTEIGTIPLKGKASEVFVYQLDGLKEE